MDQYKVDYKRHQDANNGDELHLNLIKKNRILYNKKE